MKIKQIPQDFIVDELYDLEELSLKDEQRPYEYSYFILTKENVNQMQALKIVSDALNISKKLIHFSGTKDKVGITSQLVSVYNVNEENLEKNLDFMKEKFPNMKLDFVGKFKSRLNLGDNLGNRFTIAVRDVNQDDLVRAQNNLKRIENEGVFNFFDDQRFGYANNSHIVGKYILKNEVEKAVYEIMTSLPNNSQSEILLKFNEKVVANWDVVKEQNIEKIDEIIEVCPRYLQSECEMLKHLKIHKNDFPGAFRKIHKKLRMLYVNSYQSYVFNELIRRLNEKGVINDYEELNLISHDSELVGDVKSIVDEILNQDGLSLESFKLPHMPEIKIFNLMRIVKNYPKNIEISDLEEDELNEGKSKLIVKFDLESGQYATNVIKQLFE